MRSRQVFLPVFFVGIGLCFLLLFFSLFGWLGFVTDSVSWGVFGAGKIFTVPFTIFTSANQNQIDNLKKENAALRLSLAHDAVIQADNTALRDQFQLTTPAPQKLLPVQIVGRPSTIPNVSFPESVIIDAGKSQGITIGMAVVSQSSIAGTVARLTDNYALVNLVTSKASSFAGKDTTTGAIGVVKGQGNGEIIFDNVLLSDKLKIGDTIVSQGSQDASGKGYPPDLIVGKITGIEKNPSALFQMARVQTLVAFDTISRLFILTGN
ncbi:MAG TPA: rod shape-determining protein MreC [Candidatus Saccharimonadales bacterium]|nr:rod shape-determining protein MreC [Candidatus Saccharimonadales bacterium]